MTMKIWERNQRDNKITNNKQAEQTGRADQAVLVPMNGSVLISNKLRGMMAG